MTETGGLRPRKEQPGRHDRAGPRAAPSEQGGVPAVSRSSRPMTLPLIEHQADEAKEEGSASVGQPLLALAGQQGHGRAAIGQASDPFVLAECQMVPGYDERGDRMKVVTLGADTFQHDCAGRRTAGGVDGDIDVVVLAMIDHCHGLGVL